MNKWFVLLLILSFCLATLKKKIGAVFPYHIVVRQAETAGQSVQCCMAHSHHQYICRIMQSKMNSNAAIGHVFMAPVMHTHVNRCSLSRVFLMIACMTFGNQFIASYVTIGFTVLIYNHRSIFGLQLRLSHTRLRHIIKAFVASFILNLVCFFHRRILCRVTSRYLSSVLCHML